MYYSTTSNKWGKCSIFEKKIKENHCKNKRHRKRNVFTLPSPTKRQKLIYWGEKHHFAICTAFQLLNLFNCKHQSFHFF